MKNKKKTGTYVYFVNSTYGFNFEPSFDDAFSRDILPKTKDGAYVINLYDKQTKWTHCVSLFIDRSTTLYFDGIEYIPHELLNKMKDTSVTNNIFRIQSDDYTMLGCITLIVLLSYFHCKTNFVTS